MDLALVLLLREREYVDLHVRLGGSGGAVVEAPALPDAWGAHPLTADGRRSLERDLDIGADPAEGELPRDLFGVKATVADDLARALADDADADEVRPVLLRLYLDLLRYRDVLASARAWSERAPEAMEPMAYAHHAAIMLGGPDAEASAEAVERRARRRRRGLAPGVWSWQALEEMHLAMIDRAHQVRRRIEPGFARYLTTERRFYEAERAAALEGFDDTEVPASLRELVPLAREIGVGDDPGRAFFVGRMSRAARRRADRMIHDRRAALDAWLDGLAAGALSATASAFFWLREAAEELAAGGER